MLTFAREAYADWHVEAQPLFEAHWREIALDQDTVPLDIDHARGIAAERAGQVVCYTARDAGVLQGYAAFMVGPHIHYASTRMAVNDVIYLHQRGPGAARRFVRYCNRRLVTEHQVFRVIYHEKVAQPTLGPLLKRDGFVHADNVWQCTFPQGCV